MRVAIVHDWLVGGGAELVVEQLHKLYPDAPIYTSYATDEWRHRLDDKVVTGYLQPLGKLRKFLPLPRQRWFKKIDLSDFDLVISSSGNGEAKFINVNKPSLHICYCHSPTHFYWRHYDQYLEHPGFGVFNPLARIALRLLVSPLRKRDYAAAQNPDYFIANSQHIKADIKKYYGRDSAVIHPPVNVETFAKSATTNTKRSGFVTVGRQVPYKRFDIIVEACSSLDLPLTVVGKGPDHRRLEKLAGPSIKFVYAPTAAEVARYMASAQAFLFASFEDFGITPVEAMAAGTPVIAYRGGGAVDYVVEGQTGLFFDEQSEDSLAAALASFDATKFDAQKISKFSRQFSPENFRKQFTDFIRKIKINR